MTEAERLQRAMTDLEYANKLSGFRGELLARMERIVNSIKEASTKDEVQALIEEIEAIDELGQALQNFCAFETRRLLADMKKEYLHDA